MTRKIPTHSNILTTSCIVSLLNIRHSSRRIAVAYFDLNFILLITNEVEYFFIICQFLNIFCELHTRFS